MEFRLHIHFSTHLKTDHLVYYALGVIKPKEKYFYYCQQCHRWCYLSIPTTEETTTNLQKYCFTIEISPLGQNAVTSLLHGLPHMYCMWYISKYLINKLVIHFFGWDLCLLCKFKKCNLYQAGTNSWLNMAIVMPRWRSFVVTTYCHYKTFNFWREQY